MTKPIITPFWKLMLAFASLHGYEQRHIDTLHDVWLKGAPAPNSILRNPKDYDPRYLQEGNYEARIVFPSLLARWITDVAQQRGFDDVNYREVLRKIRNG